MKPLASQIVRLTKSILLQPKDASRRPSAQFIAGKHPPFGFPTGIGLSWWYSDDTFPAIDAVTTLIIESSPSFRDCDPETVADVLTTTLQEVCADKSIFDVDAIFFGRRETLFECSRIPVPQYAETIQAAIHSNLSSRIGRRCTIYTIPRFRAPSFNIPQDSIRFVGKGDSDAWDALIQAGFDFDGWMPTRPQVGTRDDRTFAPPPDFASVIVAEDYGTPKGTRFNSILKFRKLLAVLVGVVSQRLGRPLNKAMASPFNFCIQFSHRSSPDGRITRIDCDPLVPYFISDMDVVPADVHAICDWYATSERCSLLVRGRIEKAAHFLNRAMNADDIEPYINYFVALDALFGQRRSVEASILKGVQTLGIDPSYAVKTPWLFDLRNELVHGGSRYVSEWPKSDRYTRHFKSKPMADIQALAQLAVLRGPHLLAA